MKAKTDTQLFDAYGKAFEFSFQKQEHTMIERAKRRIQEQKAKKKQ